MSVKFTTSKKFPGVSYYESSEKKWRGSPDRCFYIVYKLDGKKTREKVGWASEGISMELAAHKRAERMRGLRVGELPTKKDPTISEIWGHFSAWSESSVKHPETIENRYKLHIGPRLGHLRASQLGPLVFERMKAELMKEGYAPQTVKHILALVRGMLNKAIAWGLIRGENPISKVKLPAPANRRERFLSVEEAQALLSSLREKSPTVYGMALLSLRTGMRLGEIRALRWENVHLPTGRVRVVDAKNEESRTVYVDGEMLEYLRVISKRVGLVFPANTGREIGDLSKTFSRTVDELGFNFGVTDRRQRVSFHTLRHTFASWLAIAGVPVLTLKELLGHKTLDMTAWYAKLSPDHKMEAFKSLPALDLPSKSDCDVKKPQAHPAGKG